MRKIVSLVVVAIGAVVLSGCSVYGTPATISPTATPASTQNTTVSSNAVNIQNFAFSPATLTVKKGVTVTWINNDSAPHQIKSATFNSSQLSKGQSFSFTFDAVGTFDYSCAIHPSMAGKIIVQ